MIPDFNSLYDIYNAGNLVLIVGSEVLRMNSNDADKDGECPKTLEETIIQKIVETAMPHIPKTLSEVAIKSPDSNISSNRVKGIYNTYERDGS